MKTLLLLLVSVAVGFGCGPSGDGKFSAMNNERRIGRIERTIGKQDYGPMPTGYEDVVKRYIQPLLEHPDASDITWRFTKPEQARCNQGDSSAPWFNYGWQFSVSTHDRGKWRTWRFFARNNVLLWVTDPRDASPERFQYGGKV
jgi:hypothetical protein